VWDAYWVAESVEDALQKLRDLEGRGRLIAGGTDLVLQAQRGQCLSRAMVDVTRIPGLNAIERQDKWVVIGATATMTQIAGHPLVRALGGPLAAACGSVGGPQIRNVATLVGNVVNALPAADGAVALYALDAQVQVATPGGRTWLPIAELYRGVGECTIDPCLQMVTAIRFRPLRAGMSSGFRRLARRRALALPIINAAVVVEVQEDRFHDVRIAVGPVAPTPFRARAAEEALVGQPAESGSMARAAQLAARDARPRSSVHRGSGEYRTAMVEVLVRRALNDALDQAQARLRGEE
jgi:carbon-monoxide dehydrogenase medium subunit